MDTHAQTYERGVKDTDTHTRTFERGLPDTDNNTGNMNEVYLMQTQTIKYRHTSGHLLTHTYAHELTFTQLTFNKYEYYMNLYYYLGSNDNRP